MVAETLQTTKSVELVKQQGFHLNQQVFSREEVATIKQKLKEYLAADHPGVVKEKDGETVRGIHGSHLFDEFFADLVTDERLLGPANEYFGEPCYVHQFKVNVKRRMTGQSWPWHQDYVYWHLKDRMPSPNLLNIAIVLDDIDHLHGPLCFIPNSHKLGELTDIDLSSGAGWEQDLSETLTYQIGYDRIAPLINENGVFYAIGNEGDLLLFDPQTAHCSSVNLSPTDRELLIITYNPVSNTPVPFENPDDRRPDFISARDHTPLEVKSAEPA